MTEIATFGTACALGLPGAHDLLTFPSGVAGEDLLSRAINERAVPIFANALHHGLLEASAETHAAFAAAHEAGMQACLRLEQTTLDVADLLAAAGISFRILKGPSAAHLDYPDPSWRGFSDVDVLVRSDQYDDAVSVFIGAGGRRRSAEVRPGFDRRFGKGVCLIFGDGVQVDLHRTLASGPFGLSVDLDDLFAGRDAIVIAGQRIPVMNRELRLVHACFHAALGDAIPRVVALRDIAQLLLTTDVDVEKTQMIVARWRSTAVLAYAISAAWNTFDLPHSAVSTWAENYSLRGAERRALGAYHGIDRSYARQMTAAIPAIPGVAAKISYVRALLFVDPAYAARHDGGYRQRVRRAWRARSRQVDSA